MVIIQQTKYNKNTVAALLAAFEAVGQPMPAVLEKLDLEKLRAQNNAPLFICSFTTPQKEKAFSEFREIKEKLPSAVIIAGGPHPSGDPQECLDNGADHVVIGEAEISLPALVKDIRSGKKAGRIIRQKERTCLDDFFPFPKKDLDKALYIEITRGCPYNCAFCQATKLFGAKPRHRSLRIILESVELMLKYKLDDIRFVSPNALSYGSADGRSVNYEALSTLLASLSGMLKGRGRLFFGSFPSEVRPEFINDETLSLMRQHCDNENIIIGGQSGSDMVLNKTNRQHKTADIIKAVDISIKYGFKTNVDFIFGFDFEGVKEAGESINLMETLVKKGARIHAHRLIPLAGTEYYGLKGATIHKDILNFLHKNSGSGMVYGKY